MAADLSVSTPAPKPAPEQSPANQQPRVWPALVLIAIYWLAWGSVTLFAPGTFTQFLTLFWTPMIIAAGVLVWWLFFSKLPWSYRLWGLAWLILSSPEECFRLRCGVALG